MNEHNSNKRVILFSRDQSLIEAINLKQVGKDEHSSEFLLKVESELSNDFIAQGSMAVAYDLDLVANDLSLAAVDILQLKNADLDRPLILIGTKESLKNALAAERIGAVVTKTVSKPNAASQLLMTISAVSKKLHREEVVVQKTSNTGLYGVVGAAVCVVGIALFFMLSGQDEPDATSERNVDVVDNNGDINPSVDDPQASNLAEIAQLKSRASKAYEAGRLISPKGDNALDYYQRILAIDDYDDEAYTGKWRIVKQLRASFPKLIEAGELDQASDVVEILIEAEPFNSSNNDLQAMLDDAGETKPSIVAEAKTQTLAIESKAVAVEKLDESAEQIKRQEQDRAKKAQIEERLASKISTTIESGNLTPPQADNAYELLLSTVRQGSVRESKLTPLKVKLENQLIERMQRALVNSDIDNAANDLKFIRNLNRNNSALPGLTASLIEAQRKAQPVVATKVVATKVVAPKPIASKPAVSVSNKTTTEPANESTSGAITPFEIISKAKPDYPRRAYNLDIEGWVELEYQIDESGQPININVVNAEPKKIFDKAGLKAIKRSRFSPAKNSVTNEPVVSEVSTIRFNFSIGR